MNKVFPVSGYSMRFLLEPGDLVITEQCTPEALRPGDIALLVYWKQALPANYVIHRVILNLSYRGKRLLLTRGDARFLPDLPLSAYQAVGRVTAIVKGESLYGIGTSGWVFKAAYSFLVSTVLSFLVFAAAAFFAAACRTAPAAATGLMNAVYRCWEQFWHPFLIRFFSLPVSKKLSSTPVIEPAVKSIRSGRVYKDETWEGQVTILDYLIVAAGAKITVLPGTKIIFDKRVSRLFPVLRRDGAGKLREIHSSILVYGEFSAQGAAGRPVVFMGSAFLGMYALGSGQVTLNYFRMQGAQACAAGAGDDAALNVENGIFSLCEQGVELSGSASGLAVNCSFSGIENTALRVQDDASLLVSASEATDCRGTALTAAHSSAAGLSGLMVRGCACGLSANGSSKLMVKDCHFVSNSGHGVKISDFSALDADGCSFAENAGPSVVISNKARGKISHMSSTGSPAALVLSDAASLSLSASSVNSVESPALAMSGQARLSAKDSTFASKTDAIYASMFSALKLNSVEACSLDGAAMSGFCFPGLPAGGAARLRFKDSVFERRKPGLLSLVADASAIGRRVLFHFAVATYSLPGFSTLYRCIYLLGPVVARRLLFIRGVVALYLYRGMTKQGWIPTLSDMDLICVIETLSEQEDWLFYSRFTNRQRLLNRLLPFTGEVLLARAADFRSLVSAWGIKGREFSESSRRLAGKACDLNLPVSPGVAAMADITEAFCVYTLLSRHLFSGRLPAAFRRRSCLKSLIDVKRYLDADCALRASRQDYAAAAGLSLDNFIDFPAEKAAFEAFRALHEAARELLPSMQLETFSAYPGQPDKKYSERRRAFDADCAAAERAAGMKMGFVQDALYRLYVVLPEVTASDPAVFSGIFSAFSSLRLQPGLMGQAPVFLTAPAFELLSFTSYLNNPLFWLDLASQPSSGDVALGDGGIYCYNLPQFSRRPHKSLLSRSAALAAAHFSATWRSQWGEMPPHYFYSRAAGLRLLLGTGNPSAFSCTGALSSVFKEAYGLTLPAWEDYCAGGSCRANYEFVAAQTSAMKSEYVEN